MPIGETLRFFVLECSVSLSLKAGGADFEVLTIGSSQRTSAEANDGRFGNRWERLMEAEARPHEIPGVAFAG
jgi:hypothetical protein